MNKIAVLLISVTTMLYSNGISGVTYFDYSDDTFNLS